AAAGRRRIRVADDELGAGEIFLVVDLRALQVLHAHRVDEQRDAALLDLRVAVLHFLVESEAVLEPGAAAALDIDAELQLRIALALDQLADLRGGSVGEMKRRLLTRHARFAHGITLRPD